MNRDATAVRLTGPVRIVGSGLLGTSIALSLRSLGVDVILADASPTALNLAVDIGAGRTSHPADRPTLIVVCVPPDVTASVIVEELLSFHDAVVTDVASVKVTPLEQVRDLLTHKSEEGALSRFVGSHPLAGRERGGAAAAQGDLFIGRPWVICALPETSAHARALVEDLVLDLGATPVELSAEQHDAAVGLVSHVPQILSSVMAKQLVDADENSIRLAGQGLRDVTRIAASDPELWIQILGANSASIVPVLESLQQDLQTVTNALRDIDAVGARTSLNGELLGGNSGVARLPGKHGQKNKFTTVVVLVDDKPGQIATLLKEIGDMNVNVEDLRLEHAEGAQVGMVEVSVVPTIADKLIADLSERGWRVAT